MNKVFIGGEASESQNTTNWQAMKQESYALDSKAKWLAGARVMALHILQPAAREMASRQKHTP
ncbi:MAG TPA: hypothetical protein VG347_14950 [Verrucomicrobiae bacterium]|nr:hypothetical protein [Verrucomicrobiae bacterium]